MKNFTDIIATVCDTGGNYLPLAICLSHTYKHVYYTNPSWVDAYPKLNKAMIGIGMSPNLEVIDSPFEVYDETDFWIFPDCYYGSLEDFLVDKGEIVWGSRAGEELELERDDLKTYMTKIGLPVQKWESVKGMTNLRLYLQKNENVYVKINKWRGTIETFYSKTYDLVKPELDEIEHCLGPFSEQMDFIVEQPIPDALEVGYDGWTIKGQYPEVCLAGCEIKDKAYAGKVVEYSALSPLVTDFNSKMAAAFDSYDYKGFFSTEIRITKDKTPYMIDFTARTPCPPGEIYLELWDNLAEVMWRGANNEVIVPKASNEFAVELLIESEWAGSHFQPIYYPDKYDKYIKLKKATKIDGINYIIPQSFGATDCGAVLGFGDTLDAAIKQARTIASTVEGCGICIRQDVLDSAQEELQKFEQILA
jgi:hypothetical protein